MQNATPPPPNKKNPCLECGACCASFRVDFHPAELAGGAYSWGEGVPLALVEPINARLVRLKGTDQYPPRCAALSGTIGQSVACAIYDARPSPCREFLPEHDACAYARRRFGLPPAPRE